MPILHAPILEQAGFVAGGGEPVNYVYALKSSSYDYAQMTSEVTVPHKAILSFSLVIEPENNDLVYILKGSGVSRVYYRGSDGRFRLTSDQGNFYSITVPNLNSGTVRDVLIIIDDEGMQLYIDGVFFDTAIRNGNEDTVSVNEIGEGATTFNVTLSNIASYPMLTYDTESTNTTDEIAGNNLTYISLKDPLEESDYIKVVDND